jgi:hypothetical protein
MKNNDIMYNKYLKYKKKYLDLCQDILTYSGNSNISKEILEHTNKKKYILLKNQTGSGNGPSRPGNDDDNDEFQTPPSTPPSTPNIVYSPIGSRPIIVQRPPPSTINIGSTPIGATPIGATPIGATPIIIQPPPPLASLSDEELARRLQMEYDAERITSSADAALAHRLQMEQYNPSRPSATPIRPSATPIRPSGSATPIRPSASVTPIRPSASAIPIRPLISTLSSVRSDLNYLDDLPYNKSEPVIYATIHNTGTIIDEGITYHSQCFWISIQDYYKYKYNTDITIRKLKTDAGLDLLRTQNEMADIDIGVASNTRYIDAVNRLARALNIRIRIYVTTNGLPYQYTLERLGGNNIPIPAFDTKNIGAEIINIARAGMHFELIIDGPFINRLERNRYLAPSIRFDRPSRIKPTAILISKKGEEFTEDDKSLNPNQKEAVRKYLQIQDNNIRIQLLNKSKQEYEKQLLSLVDAIINLNSAGLREEEKKTLVKDYQEQFPTIEEEINKIDRIVVDLNRLNTILTQQAERLDV